ncbi:Methyltransf_21 domain-containing protein [Cephalotus follicularis]|uniref:Methyltransf_21 domain-containing protein n=1 Tax=Cephalotus follicularis TaxID=3775 RepID=A0A1Q3ASG5_CEPFO|nr:Methyltransf_21 domain-containing protein [Cephalotus follicularis]
MDPLTLKLNSNNNNNNLVRNTIVRVLSFCVLIFAVRFAYFVTVKGGSCVSNDFCFFSQNVKQLGRATVSDTRNRRKIITYYSSVFQDLIAEGFLSPISKSLCIQTITGETVTALKEIGVSDSIAISKKPSLLFVDNTFDFVFSPNGGLDRSVLGSEIGRTLKPGGFLVVHTMAKDEYSLHSLLDLFTCCGFIRSREINGLDSSTIREVVLRKETPQSIANGHLVNKCLVPGYKRDIIRMAEELIDKEPLKPWITLKRNMKKIKYLSSMVDISFKDRYIYVDVGARSYSSSIVSWFKKQYPKQNKTFRIYAIEADKAFHNEYRGKKAVTLLPYAAWIRNETLFFEITRRDNPSKKEMGKGRGMGRIHTVQSSATYVDDVDKIYGFDFAGWLKSVVKERDFVVVKMDVEGTEFHLIPRLIETGAICLIDEIFLECHYNRWQRCCPGQRSVKYQKTYDQCLELLRSLRERGVLVHQWW